MGLELLIQQPIMIFLRDFWVVIIGVVTTLYFSITYVGKTILRINKIDKIEADVQGLKIDMAYIKGKMNGIESRLDTIEELLKNLIHRKKH